MWFMNDDEFLLGMAHCYDRCPEYPDYSYILTIDDRKRLYDAGIRTMHEQPSWNMIEPSKGNYNFEYLDEIINRNREARMKSLIQIHGWRIPNWIPDEWRAKLNNGTYESQALSMWNEEAQEYSDRHYLMLDEHYRSDPDIAFFFGEWQGGEGAYPPDWCLYDDPAIEDYKKTYGTSAMPEPLNPDTMLWFGNKITKHFIRKGALLYPKFHEIWNAQQYLMDTWTKGFGNFTMVDIYKGYRELFPDSCIVCCQCTYYDEDHKQDNVDFVDMLGKISQCETIVEAMHCSGLPITTPKAIAHGFRAQIVFPAYENHTSLRLENWMVNNIKVSNELWRRHYEDSRNSQNV